MATNKKGLTARIAAGFGAAAFATLTVLGGALPASAAAPQDINPTTPVDLTVHVFEEQGSGVTHNGAQLAPAALAGLTGLEGVTFTATRVPSATGGLIDLSTVAGWQQVETTRTVADAEARIAQHPTAAPTTTSAPSTSGGAANFDGLVRSLYLVQQSGTGANQIAAQTAPFLVTLPLASANTWVYDVHVYPKNSVTSVEKSVDVDGAYLAGHTVDWTIRATVPQLAGNATLGTLVVTDTLDPRLTRTATTVTTTNGALVETTDYTVTQSGQTVTVTITPSRLAQLAVGVDVEVTHTTAVNPLAGTPQGVIENRATVAFNGTPVNTNTVDTQWGSLSVLKFATKDAAPTDTSARLAGAVFTVYPTEADAGANTNAITTITSNADGIASVAAFRAGTFWIVETTAPTGYTPHAGAIKVTVNAGDFDTTATFQAEVGNTQIPAYALPVTGGSGQTAFMIGGAGLLVGALGFMLIRRRKAKAEA